MATNNKVNIISASQDTVNVDSICTFVSIYKGSAFDSSCYAMFNISRFL